jgi:hypothetical protein
MRAIADFIVPIGTMKTANADSLKGAGQVQARSACSVHE